MLGNRVGKQNAKKQVEELRKLSIENRSKKED